MQVFYYTDYGSQGMLRSKQLINYMNFDQNNCTDPIISNIVDNGTCVRVSGYICPLMSGNYYFYCNSNGACTLYIDNTLIGQTTNKTINNNQYYGSIYLDSTYWSPFLFEYFKNYNDRILFQLTTNMDNGVGRDDFSQKFNMFFNGDDMLVTNLGTTFVNGPLFVKQGLMIAPNNNFNTNASFYVNGKTILTSAGISNASIVNACISSLSVTNACICNLSLMGNIFAVNGYFTNNVIAGYSDERMKIKTSNISNSLDKITSLSCFKYYPNTSVCEQLGIKQDYTVDIGLSAQEVQKCFPEIVCLSPYDININEVTNEVVSRTGLDLLTIRYERFVPIIIQCIQELQAQRKYDKNT